MDFLTKIIKSNIITENYIGDRGTYAISEALKTNSTLTELNLSCE